MRVVFKTTLIILLQVNMRVIQVEDAEKQVAFEQN